MALNIVILAAGKGTRMKSRRPKVLHALAGRSLLQHVLDAAHALQAECTVVVTGHGADEVESAVRRTGERDGLRFARQEPPRGTGDAVKQALPALDDAAPVTLVLNGDVPLITTATLQRLATASAGAKLALLTIDLDAPTGYGRIVREGDAVRAIVEERDATTAQRALREVYTGFMAAPTAALKRWVAALTPNNIQGEYYLTDVVALAVADGVPVVAAAADREAEVLGVNSPQQLAALERLVQREQAEALLEAGVRLADPARVDVRGRLHCGQDVEIDVGCVFEGEVTLGDGVRVGPYSVLRDTVVGPGTEVRAYSHLDGARVGAEALIGPYARLRPGAVLGDEVHIGNFVEVKNATLSHGAKANHLAYLGDATVGARVNFGAGSITANYDGANKHRTTIGADVHVGSNCVLIAPLEIGDGATVGGGSTIARDVPAGTLAVSRAKQVSIERWKRPAKGEPPRRR